MARPEDIERAAITAFSVAFSPLIVCFSFFIVLVSLGVYSPARKFYIQFLIRIFEWGRIKIENHEKVKAYQFEKDRRTISESLDIGMMNERGDSNGFHLSDAMDFCKNGIQTIVDDEVTKRFDAAVAPESFIIDNKPAPEPHCTTFAALYPLATFRVIVVESIDAFCMAVCGISLIIIGTAIIGYMPEGRENRAKSGGICVANHTSPIDIIILGSDNCYAMIGQTQGGLMGIIQRAMCRAESHIFFQRSEIKDRLAVSNRLRAHVKSNKLPILIFPEGTCINNTSIMMFKKGSFEGGGVIYPAAIKYDSRFADPFWNSSETSLSTHMLMILTSWALVVDVWYLPPETQKPQESSVEFANRVKANIARMGGLVDLEWLDYLKR